MNVSKKEVEFYSSRDVVKLTAVPIAPLDGRLNASCDALGNAGAASIRRRLIEQDKVEAISAILRNPFYTTGSSETLWILNQENHGKPWLDGFVECDGQVDYGEVSAPAASCVWDHLPCQLLNHAILCNALKRSGNDCA